MPKCLFPLPQACLHHLKQDEETGIGYKLISIDLIDGRHFDQVVVSEGCIIQLRGYEEIPFAPQDVAFVSIDHKRWNFRDGSDVRVKYRAATA